MVMLFVTYPIAVHAAYAPVKSMAGTPYLFVLLQHWQLMRHIQWLPLQSEKQYWIHLVMFLHQQTCYLYVTFYIMTVFYSSDELRACVWVQWRVRWRRSR